MRSATFLLLMLHTNLVLLQAEIGRPSSLQPDKGKVAVFIDCSPTAEPTFGVSFSILWPVLVLSTTCHICSLDVSFTIGIVRPEILVITITLWC